MRNIGSATFSTYIIAVDPAGNTLWTKEYPRTLTGSAKALVPMPDGGVAYLGTTDFANNQLVRFDACGNTIWGPFNYQINDGSGTYHPMEADYSMPTNAILVTGFTRSNNLVDVTAGLSIDINTGATNWAWRYPTNPSFIASTGQDVIQNRNNQTGGITGYANDTNGTSGIYNVIFDLFTGNTINKRVVKTSATSFEFGRAVQASHMPDHFVVAGPSSINGDDMFFLEIDGNGIPIWSNSYPLTVTNGDYMESIDLTTDGYFLTSHAPQSVDYHDLWTDLLGKTQCCPVDTMPVIHIEQNNSLIAIPLTPQLINPWQNRVIEVQPGALIQDICNIDTEAPTIVCPPNITLSANCGDTVVNYCIPSPSVTDNCDPSPVVTYSVPICQDYPVGTITTVTITATDAAGNSSTCTFDVVVDPAGGSFSAWINATTCTATDQRLTAFPGPTADHTYQWSNGSTNRTDYFPPGTYCVTVTNIATGCTAVACAEACTKPNVEINPITIRICEGTGYCVPLMAHAGSAGAVTYQWNTGGTSQTEIVCPTTTTLYRVTVTNYSGCTAVKARKVFVVPCPNDSGCNPPYAKSNGNGASDADTAAEREEAELEIDSDLVNVFPNPANESFFLDYELKIEEMETLALFDVNGKKIQDIPIFAEGITEVETNELPNGIYFLQINKQKMQKIVVVHEI